MPLKTGDPYLGTGFASLALTPLNTMPMAISTTPEARDEGVFDTVRAGDMDQLTEAQINELVNGMLLVAAPGSALAMAWNAIVSILGALFKIPKWVYVAILGGVSLYSIIKGLNTRQVVRPSPGANGGNGTAPPPGYDIRGPGVKEPTAGTYYRHWRTVYERRDGRNGYVWFWAMNDGYILSQDSLSGRWRRWKPVKPIAVLGRKMNMNEFLKADRFLDRFARRLAKRSSKLKLQRG